ncbi:MAG: histidine kinase, partial [Erysipelotrichaceae bacterium]|nr:histidine kinase [Erysipelotrichaceae bacterium]
SDLILYTNSGLLGGDKNTYLKMFVKEYSTNHFNSINNRKWSLVQVMDNTYYYNAMRLGKYVIGAVSDVRLYQVDFPYEEFEYKTINTFLTSNDMLYTINGDDDLLESLDRSDKSAYFSGKYAIISSRQQNADATTLFVNETESIFNTFKTASYILIADSAICVGLVFIMIYNIRKRINDPIRTLIKANKTLSDGDFEYKLNVQEAGSDEFEGLYKSYNEMSDKIKNLTIEQYDAEIKRQQNQLKMLRAQVKPHTFLNAINTINNMTYTGKPEDIRRYIAAFASFTRYMLYKAKDWTTVEDEIKNIDNYTKMQQIRFPESIDVVYDIDPEIYSENIPYLVLFSLVQNSFKHAMTLDNKAHIEISGAYYEEEGFKGFRMIEEDDGPGFSDEALEKIISAEADDPFTKEHLGLTNVRYSLNLIYKRDDLLRISNREEGGALIELVCPHQVYDEQIGSS